MWDQVLLVDQSERFVFKPMLYELLTGGMLFNLLNRSLNSFLFMII